MSSRFKGPPANGIAARRPRNRREFSAVFGRFHFLLGENIARHQEQGPIGELFAEKLTAESRPLIAAGLSKAARFRQIPANVTFSGGIWPHLPEGAARAAIRAFGL